MKKLIIKLIVAVVVVLVLAVVVSIFYLGSIVKKGVETIGPTITKTDMKVGGVTVSLLSGHAKITGLVIGNPEGYKSESAIKMGLVSATVQPASVFSDKIVVKSIVVQGPEITYEGNLRGGSNLKKLLDNVEAAAGGDKGAPKETPDTGAKKAPKKLQVDEFVLTDAKIHVSLSELGGKSATVVLPMIHLTDLGKGSEGITPAELTEKVLTAVLDGSIKAAGSAATDLGKDAVKEAGKAAGEAVEKAAKSVTDLFKKKP
jgi:uncharacterized protein involved in outer membrane biogenesis